MVKITIAMLKILRELYILHNFNNSLSKKKGREVYIVKLMKRSGYSYLHVYDMVKKLEEIGMIRIEKKGSRSLITLTEKGKEVAKLSYLLFEEISKIGKEGDKDGVVDREV